MTRATKLLLLGFVIFALTGCGYTEGVVQSDQKSFIAFTGKVVDAVAYVDQGAPFSLESERLVQYQIRPGKHKVVVKRNGQVVVDREVLIGNGMVKEIQVP